MFRRVSAKMILFSITSSFFQATRVIDSSQAYIAIPSTEKSKVRNHTRGNQQ